MTKKSLLSCPLFNNHQFLHPSVETYYEGPVFHHKACKIQILFISTICLKQNDFFPIISQKQITSYSWLRIVKIRVSSFLLVLNFLPKHHIHDQKGFWVVSITKWKINGFIIDGRLKNSSKIIEGATRIHYQLFFLY